MLKKVLVAVLVVLLYSGTSYAEHPLITDEAETLDKGEAEVELNAEFSREENDVDGVTVTEKETELEARLTYGLIDNLEVELEVPYEFTKEEEEGETSKAEGFGDVGIEVKWRFYEENDLSLALKPSISFPTGSTKKELGRGKILLGLMFLASKEFDDLDLAFHLNVGYRENEENFFEGGEEARKGRWHASLAAEKGIVKNLTGVANIGVESNPEKDANTHPAFILGGLIYNITKKLSVDFGIKGGITTPEDDISYLFGLKWSL